MVENRTGMDVILNPLALPRASAYPASLHGIISPDSMDAAKREIRSWPGYEPTPLVSLTGLAREWNVGEIRYKDESTRFRLGSFKVTGGAYAVARYAVKISAPQRGEPVTIVTATDGNHGRAVAWGAKRFGCRCRVYVHERVSDARVKAIEDLGATVICVSGNYDDSVRRAAKDAEENRWQVISDTSYEGYSEVPSQIMQGYTAMLSELPQQMNRAIPTHVFVQAGVGGLAAAVCAYYWLTCGPERPRLVIVEPDDAPCLFESAKAGTLVPIRGNLDTIMAGLACGEASPIAWEILSKGAFAFAKIPDWAAEDAMRKLASPAKDDTPLVAGESAAAGIAAVGLARRDAGLSDMLQLDGNATVLVFGTEGDTDPQSYCRIVGRTAQEVLSRG